MRITTGKYAGHTGTVESNVYQRTVDYPDEFHNGHHVMLDTGVLVTLRWEQVEGLKSDLKLSSVQFETLLGSLDVK